ncbi:22755_t:CDS:2 [Gigaspora rosea]|nr:22755_t:CDS:2 [Gigaspora rosea]
MAKMVEMVEIVEMIKMVEMVKMNKKKLVFYTNGAYKVDHVVGSQELGIGWVQLDIKKRILIESISLRVVGLPYHCT